MGHLCAWPKAGLSNAGPGWRIVNMNEETVRAQEAWRLLNAHWWLFIVYGVALMGVCVLLKAKAVWWPIRLAVFAALAIPGCWYFLLSSYLAGKLLGV